MIFDRNRHRRLVMPASIAFLASWLVATSASAQAPRSYVWHADLVGVDAATSSIRVKAPFREHILRYVDDFHPNEKLRLTWASTHEGQADDIIYLGKPDKTVDSDFGYILLVDFVSADKAAKTVTFRVPVPATALAALKSMHAGDAVAVTSPFVQPATRAAITSIAKDNSGQTTKK